MTEEFLKKYNLKDYPFPTSSATEEKEAKGGFLWADLEEVKEELENFIEMNLSTPASFSLLTWGLRGGGKSYAMNYFMAQSYEEKKFPLFVPISLRVSKTALRGLYLVLIETLRDKIKEPMFISEEFGDLLQYENRTKIELEKELGKYTPIENIRKILAKWLAAMVLRNEKEREKVEKILKLGRVRGETKLEEDDILEILSTAFNFLSAHPNLQRFRFILWIDEWENIRDIPTMEYLRINDAIRYLMDHLPYNFTLIINVTIRPGEGEDDVPKYFTSQVYDRFNRKLWFPTLSENDGLKYTLDRLECYRLSPQKRGEDKYFPFIEDSLRQTFKILEHPLPRTINNVLGYLLDIAERENKKNINSEFIKKHEEDIRSFSPFS